jgi:putative ABC transport system ATP-binding protein
VIRIQHLRYAWPKDRGDCLQIDTFEVGAGCGVFLHGPSGSGKSTLLGLLAGVLRAREGRVELLGVDWSSLTAHQRDTRRADHVGYIFQQFNLLPYLDALDNVLLPCRFSARRERRAAAAAGSALAAAASLLQRVGLAQDHWHRPAGALSVGQQQRVAAARALIGTPEVVIADEPTSALDTELRDAFVDLLLGECRAAGSALVFVSHDRALAQRFDARCSLGEINRIAAQVDGPPTGAAAP